MFLDSVGKIKCYYLKRLAHTLLQLLILQKKRSETPIFNICPTVGFRQNMDHICFAKYFSVFPLNSLLVVTEFEYD